MTDQEKLLYIEAERAKLQKRLSKKTGIDVHVEITIHQIERNGDNRNLARAGFENGWNISRNGQTAWVAAPVFLGTTVFFQRKRKQVTA